MIPYDVDPSLHTAEPPPPQLDDGFSPPVAATAKEESAPDAQGVDPSLWAKSAF
jgi:hypothetical protein